ncbi:hypothetical protein PR048_030146 [Dryococelus australis]|uniref:Uncharacterized protein n=1 Tax=Dryococelus australis TaxID=614101 RepID=A0ABQ9G8J2_9NEOP|nr:hypothetical protein PR048_030146 [Dryococelus australis]
MRNKVKKDNFILRCCTGQTPKRESIRGEICQKYLVSILRISKDRVKRITNIIELQENPLRKNEVGAKVLKVPYEFFGVIFTTEFNISFKTPAIDNFSSVKKMMKLHCRLTAKKIWCYPSSQIQLPTRSSNCTSIISPYVTGVPLCGPNKIKVTH